MKTISDTSADMTYQVEDLTSISNTKTWKKSKDVDLYRTLLGSMIRITLSAIIWSVLASPVFLIIYIFLLFSSPVFSSFSREVTIFLLSNFPATVFICWIFFQIRKVWKRAKQTPDRTFARRIWRNFLLAPIALLLAFYLPFTIFHFITMPTKELQEYDAYWDCEHTTEKLMGGWREFKGQKYNLQMCQNQILERGFMALSRPNIVGYKYRLAVFDQEGNLQALGYFTSVHENYFPLKITENSIEFGYSEEDSYKRVIKMPPSKLEWIRARLPSISDDLFDR
jgi:hypothetical protein